MTTHCALVSVLIPVFNSEDYIRKALISIASQTYPNIEVIIVDDCSTDSSVRTIKDFFADYSHMHQTVLVNEVNLGVSATRNKLVDHANGDLLCFLDSDDFLERDAIEYLVDIITKNNTSMSQCLYYSESVSGDSTGSTNDFAPNIILQGKDAVFSMLENQISGFLWHKIFKREVFAPIRFDEELNAFEDYLVIMEMFINGADISFGDERKYHYVQHASSLTKKSYRKALDRLEYLNLTKQLVSPLVTSDFDRLRLVKHEYLVYLMVFNNAIKFGANYRDVATVSNSIDCNDLIKMKSHLNIKRFYSMLLIRLFPLSFYFLLKLKEKINF